MVRASRTALSEGVLGGGNQRFFAYFSLRQRLLDAVHEHRAKRSGAGRVATGGVERGPLLVLKERGLPVVADFAEPLRYGIRNLICPMRLEGGAHRVGDLLRIKCALLCALGKALARMPHRQTSIGAIAHRESPMSDCNPQVSTMSNRARESLPWR